MLLQRFETLGRRAAILVCALVLAGCAGVSGPAGEEPSATADSAGAATVRRSDAKPARVKVSEGVGFTVTEVVSISGAARGKHREALAALAAGEGERGVALLLEVIEAAPDATGPYVDLGIAYRRQDALEDSLTALQSALAATPDHPVAHNELAISLRRLGRFAEARQSYERALAIFPEYHFARRNLAVLCDLYLADLPCALEHYEAYRVAVPDDPEVEMWIADLRMRTGTASQ